MFQGKESLAELASEVQRQTEAKRDFKGSVRVFDLDVPYHQNGELIVDPPQLTVSEHGTFPVNEWARKQLAQRMDVPVKYAETLYSEYPELYAKTFRHLFAHKTNKQSRGQRPPQALVRTLDGECRAFLGAGYRPLDNYELCEAILPTLRDSQLDLQIASCDITQTKLYIKATTPEIRGEIKAGDTVQAGVVISNSEVGAGSISVQYLLYRCVCSNGMILPDQGMRKAHVGGRSGYLENMAQEYLRDDTRAAIDSAFWKEVRDAVGYVLHPDTFQNVLAPMREAAEDYIAKDPEDCVEVFAEQQRLREGERKNLLRHFYAEDDFSRWGLANAVTRTAQDVKTYDRASELEELGGRVIHMRPQDWKIVAA